MGQYIHLRMFRKGAFTPGASGEMTVQEAERAAPHSTTHMAQFFASWMSLLEVLPKRNSSVLDL